MHFEGKISVVIADKVLQTVVSISTKNDAMQVGASCDLVVPLNCRIQYRNGNHDYLTDYAKNIFNVGDAITVTSWYEGFDKINEFSGFIYDFIEGMPLTIKCLDYIYFFNLGTFGNSRVVYRKGKQSKKVITGTGASYTSIRLKTLLQNIIEYVNDTINNSLDDAEEVSLDNNVFDMTLENITFVNMSPAAILEWLKKELGLNISLNGTKLYCNVASTTVALIKYDTRINVIKCDLQKAIATFQRIRLKAWFLREDGTRDSIEVGDENGTLKEVFFYKVARDQALYTKMANEALIKYKQEKYNGSITTLLYPVPALFGKAQFNNFRYPSLTGNYAIKSIETDFNEEGFHRKLKFAFLSDI